MMMTRYLFLMIFGLWSYFSFSQVDTLFLKNEIRGTVVDKKTNKKLQFATVYNLSNNQVAETDDNGNFILKVNSTVDTIITFYLGYKSDTTIVSKLKDIIYLEPTQNLLSEIEITENRNARIINNPKATPIKLVAADSIVYLLSELQRGFNKKYELEIFQNDGVSLRKIPIDHANKVDVLKNCQNQVFLHIDDECIKIAYVNQQLSLIEKMTFEDYQSLFGHCLASREGRFIYQVARWNDLEKNYFIVNPEEGKSTLIKSIVHEDRLQLYKQDMGFIEYGKNVSTMEVTDAGQNSKIRRAQASSFLLENIIHKNHTVNYFFALDTGFVFFNFDEKQIGFFNRQGDLTRTILEHQVFQPKSKKSSIVYDELAQIFYYVEDTNDDYILSEIDFGTRSISEGIALNLALFECIAVVDGNLFALGRSSIIGDNELYFKRLD